MCVAIFGLPAAFLARRLRMDRGSFFLLQMVALAPAILFVFLARDIGQDSAWLRMLPAWGAALALSLYIPCARGGADFAATFRAHVQAALTAFVVAVALNIGISLVLGLFSLLLADWGMSVNANIMIALYVVVLPGLYLNLLPEWDGEAPAPKPTRLDRMVTEVTGMPMMATATVVFLIYIGKCAVSLAWPVGEIGPMVLVYSLLGLAVYLLSFSFDDRGARLYRRLFPFALAAMTVLQLISICLRLASYGFTEPRYYLLMAALFSLFCGLYLILRRGRCLHALPLAAACLMVFSLLPWVGASGISGASQRTRLTQLLEQSDMLAEEKIVPNANVPFEQRKEITSVYTYLRQSGHDAGLGYLPAETGQEDKDPFAALFGFAKVYAYDQEDRQRAAYFTLESHAVMDVAGFDAIAEISLTPLDGQKSPTLAAGGKSYGLRYDKGSRGQLVLTLCDENGAAVLSLDTLPLMEDLLASGASLGETLPVERLSVSNRGSGLSVRLVLENGRVSQLASGDLSLSHGDGYLLLGAE